MEMAGDVSATRIRSSLSCEAGQPTIVDGFGSSGAASLSSAIADLIHKKGLPYSLSNDPLLLRVIKCARLAPESYKPPKPDEVGGRYLIVSSARYETKNSDLIKSVASKFGYSIMSDGATVLHVPLINALGGIPNALPVMLGLGLATSLIYLVNAAGLACSWVR